MAEAETIYLTPSIKQEEEECISTEEDVRLLPVNVEIEEDPLGESSCRNSEKKEILIMPPTAIQFRNYGKRYAECLSSNVINEENGSCEEKNGIMYGKQSITGAIKTGGKLYTCSYCMKYFKLKRNLMLHLKLHIVNIIYQCSICQMTFTDSSTLASHREGHSSENAVGCQVFETTSEETAGSLSESSGRDHRFVEAWTRGPCSSSQKKPSERRLTCGTCNKRFAVFSDLTKHVRVHTGERPYVCGLCRKGFKQSSALSSHFRTHTGERPYVCAVCSKAFTQSSALNTHMRIHTDLSVSARS